MSFFSDPFGKSKRIRRVRNRPSSRPIVERKVQLDFINLEQRIVPAVAFSSATGGILTVAYGANSDTATVTINPDSSITLSGTSAAGTLTYAPGLISSITTSNPSFTGTALNFAGAGTLTLSGGLTSSNVAGVTINGALNASSLNITATDIVSNAAGTLTLTGGNTSTFSNAGTDAMLGTISGAGNVTHSGAGTLSINAASTFGGNIVSNSGTLKLLKSNAVTVVNPPLTFPAAAAGQMFGTVSQSPTATTTTLSVTSAAYTLSSPANMLVLTIAGKDSGGSTTVPPTAVFTASWGGVAMTSAGIIFTATSAGAAFRYDQIFYLKSPTAGSKTFVVNGTTLVGPTDVYGDAESLTGVDLTQNPTYASLLDSGNATTLTAGQGVQPSVTFTSQISAGSMAIGQTIVGTGAASNGIAPFTVSSTDGTATPFMNIALNDGNGQQLAMYNVTNMTAATSASFTATSLLVNTVKIASDGMIVPPAPGNITLANNVVYNASTTIDVGATNVDDSFGLLSIPNGGTTATLSGGRTDQFTGISSTGSLNSIVSGTAAPIIAIAPAGTVTVTNPTDSLTIGPVIGDYQGNGTAAPTIVNKAGSGTLKLTGNNTYTGGTTISAGTLSVGLLANGGTVSGIGASSSAAGNLVFAGGTLAYTGGSTSNNRNFTINSGTTGTIDVPSGVNLTLAGAAASSTGNLTKVDSGTLTLAGANQYTGSTTVSAGALAITGSLASTAVALVGSGTTMSVSSGGVVSGSVSLASGSGAILTLGNTGVVSGAVTEGAGTQLVTGTGGTVGGITSAGGIVNLGGTGTVGTLTLTGASSFDAGTTLNFDYISSSQFDRITIGSASLADTNPGAVINVTGSSSNMVAGTYTLIAGSGVLPSGTAGGFVLGTTPGGNFNYALARSVGNGIQLVVTSNSPNLVWESSANVTLPLAAPNAQTDGGGTWNSPSAFFYNIQPGGVQAGFSNSGTADITFGAGGLGDVVTLGGPIRAGGNLIFGSVINGAPYTLSGTVANSLTIVGSILAGSNATIAAPVVLAPTGASENWSVSPGVTLTVSGAISEAVAGTGLSKSGTGTLLLSGVGSSYTGGTTITSGVLQMGASNALPNSGVVSLTASGATLDLSGTTQTLSNALSAVTGSVININGGTLDLVGAASPTLSGTFAGGGTLIKDGAGNLDLLAAGSFSGTANIINGSLEGGAASTFAAGATINISSGATLKADIAGAFSGDVINVLGGATLSILGSSALSNATINYFPGAVISEGAGTPLGGATLNLLPGATFVPAFGDEIAGANVIISGPNASLAGAVLDVTTFAGSAVNQVTLLGGSILATGGTGSLTAAQNYLVQSGTISAALGGAAGVGMVKSTAGTLFLNVATTYPGATTINAGTVSLAANVTAFQGAVAVSGAGTILSIGSSALSINGNFQLGGPGVGATVQSSGTGTTITVNSPNKFDLQNGTVNVSLAGSGSLTQSTAGTTVLNFANSYTGSTTVTGGGTLRLDIVGALPTTTAVILGAPTAANQATAFGTLDLQTFSQTIAGLTMNSNVSTVTDNVNIGSLASLTVNVAAATTGFLVGANNSATDVTKTTFTGGGTLNVIGANNSNTTVLFGNPTVSSANLDAATVDMTALSAAQHLQHQSDPTRRQQLRRERHCHRLRRRHLVAAADRHAVGDHARHRRSRLRQRRHRQ